MKQPSPFFQEQEFFKNWIIKRFISESDLQNMSAINALAWSAALKEMSELVTHEVVPFHRRSGGES